MQENTNKAIAFNSIVLYGKMVINTVCALLTTRFALIALGIVDFGLFSVLGGIISFISIFNTIMLSVSNRFIAVAIGKGDTEGANKQFNVNLVIHVLIALSVIVVAYPIGDWYIPRYVNYDGPLDNAMMVYLISIAGAVLSFVGVPYNGLLMAKERFLVFSLVDVFIHIIKLAVAWLLISFFEHKLLVYSLTMAFATAFPTLIYIAYCIKHFREVVRFKFVTERFMYKRVFSFSSWVAIGAVAQVGKIQGAALVVNTFFNTVMNSAMGVATSINSYVMLFSQSVTQPMQPQLTKSYAAGNYDRTDELLIMSTKYSFLFAFLAGSVFLVAPEWLLGLWLEEVPQYASVFLVLFVIDSLIRSLNAGIANIIFASGNISLFQIIVSCLNIFSVILGYIVLKLGAPAYFLVVAYIVVSIVMFFSIQYALHRTLDYDNSKLWKYSYLPSLTIVVLFIPIVILPISISPLLKLVLSFAYLCVLEWYIGFTKTERTRIITFIKQKINK